MHTLDAFLADIQIEGGQAVPRRYATQRGTGAEAVEVKRRLGNFDSAHSPIALLLRETFPGATKNELISVAQMTMVVANQRFPGCGSFVGTFDRITRRSMDLIIKWYSDNWMVLRAIFRDVGLADDRFRPISHFLTQPVL
jgi:hypothetical protein